MAKLNCCCHRLAISLSKEDAEKKRKKQENTQKRKAIADRQNEEAKDATINKLLNKQTSSRLKKEEEKAV
jgi:hypothetical protein